MLFLQSFRQLNDYLQTAVYDLPLTDGENRMTCSYKNSPYFINASVLSSAFLNVISNPRAEKLINYHRCLYGAIANGVLDGSAHAD